MAGTQVGAGARRLICGAGRRREVGGGGFRKGLGGEGTEKQGLKALLGYSKALVFYPGLGELLGLLFFCPP